MNWCVRVLFLHADVGLWMELWLVTEYHPAGSLFDCLNRSPVSIDAMMRMSLSIVSGLVHLHMDIPGTQGNLQLTTGVSCNVL